MTRRDIMWRAIGAMLGVGGCGAAVAMDGSPLAIGVFPVALLGIALIVNGKRFAVIFRAECRGHHHTAEAIHAVRLRRNQLRSDHLHTASPISERS